MNDPNSTVSQTTAAWTTGSLSPQSLTSSMTGNIAATLNTFSDRESFYYPIYGANTANESYRSSTAAINADKAYWPLASSGFVSSVKKVGGADLYIGTPVSAMIVTNAISTASLEFVLEYTEHWEVAHDTQLSTLHTHSAGNLTVAHGLNQLMHAAAEHRSSQPKLPWIQLVKSVARSPTFTHLIKDAPMIGAIVSAL